MSAPVSPLDFLLRATPVPVPAQRPAAAVAPAVAPTDAGAAAYLVAGRLVTLPPRPFRDDAGR